MRLVLTDQTNEHHAYKIPGCIFDPKSPINISGIPPLGKYFNDSTDVHKSFDNNGTTIKSVATKSNFVWDHGRHERQFMHSSSHMPELHLLVVHGYYNALCHCIHNFLKDKLHYAFSSSYSIEPQIEKSVPPNPSIIYMTTENWTLNNQFTNGTTPKMANQTRHPPPLRNP